MKDKVLFKVSIQNTFCKCTHEYNKYQNMHKRDAFERSMEKFGTTIPER